MGQMVILLSMLFIISMPDPEQVRYIIPKKICQVWVFYQTMVQAAGYGFKNITATTGGL